MFPLYVFMFLESYVQVKPGLWIFFFLTYSCDFHKMSGLGYEGPGTRGLWSNKPDRSVLVQGSGIISLKSHHRKLIICTFLSFPKKKKKKIPSPVQCSDWETHYLPCTDPSPVTKESISIFFLEQNRYKATQLIMRHPLEDSFWKPCFSSLLLSRKPLHDKESAGGEQQQRGFTEAIYRNVDQVFGSHRSNTPEHVPDSEF